MTIAPSLAGKPNIVLILADDLDWSDLGCYGSEIPTPALDSLATQGMLATRCYTASRCSPSRASLTTGCEPYKVDVGLLDDDSGRPGYRGRLNPDIPTLPGISSLKNLPFRKLQQAEGEERSAFLPEKNEPVLTLHSRPKPPIRGQFIRKSDPLSGLYSKTLSFFP